MGRNLRPMFAALALALALSSDVREALPTDRWTPQAVRAVVSAVLLDDRIDEAEADLLGTLSQRKPYPPAPAPPAREAHLLGLLVTPVDLGTADWRTRVEIASLSIQTEGLIVGLTAREITLDAEACQRLLAENAALPSDLRDLGAKILEDAQAQVQMEAR